MHEIKLRCLQASYHMVPVRGHVMDDICWISTSALERYEYPFWLIAFHLSNKQRIDEKTMTLFLPCRTVVTEGKEEKKTKDQGSVRVIRCLQ